MKHAAGLMIVAAVLAVSACAGGSGGDNRSEPEWRSWGLGGRAS